MNKKYIQLDHALFEQKSKDSAELSKGQDAIRELNKVTEAYRELEIYNMKHIKIYKDRKKKHLKTVDLYNKLKEELKSSKQTIVEKDK